MHAGLVHQQMSAADVDLLAQGLCSEDLGQAMAGQAAVQHQLLAVVINTVALAGGSDRSHPPCSVSDYLSHAV